MRGSYLLSKPYAHQLPSDSCLNLEICSLPGVSENVVLYYADINKTSMVGLRPASFTRAFYCPIKLSIPFYDSYKEEKVGQSLMMEFVLDICIM